MTNNLRMGHKLWLSVLAIIVLLVAVVGFRGYRSSKSQAQADAVTRELATRVESALKWQGLTETNAARTQTMIVSSDPAVEAEFKDVISHLGADQPGAEVAAGHGPHRGRQGATGQVAAARSAMLDFAQEGHPNEERRPQRQSHCAGQAVLQPGGGGLPAVLA